MKPRSPRNQRKAFQSFLSNKISSNRVSANQLNADANFSLSKSASSARRHYSETGVMTETTLKLFVGLFISFVASISLVRLIPYHFAQSIKLRELRAQVQETEYRVKSKKLQLMKNFDPQKTEHLREKYSSRINKNKIRLFLRD